MNNRVPNMVGVDLRNPVIVAPTEEIGKSALKYKNAKYDYYWCTMDNKPYAVRDVDTKRIKIIGRFIPDLIRGHHSNFCSPLSVVPSTCFYNDIISVEDWDFNYYCTFIPKEEFFRAKKITNGERGFFMRAKNSVYFFAYLKNGSMYYDDIIYYQFLSFIDKSYIIDDFSHWFGDDPCYAKHYEDSDEEIEVDNDPNEDLYLFDEKKSPKKPKQYKQPAPQVSKNEIKVSNETKAERLDRILDDILRVGLDNIIKEDREFLDSYK
jgi:hypothetical protein